MITMMKTGKIKGIEFTTPTTTLNKLVTNGTDSDIANKVVAVASIIKAFTKNVMIVVNHENCGLFHGEAWFYLKNATDEERFNNATAYKVLVNLIDPSIKVSAFLWPDDDDGTRLDVIDVNFFGYTLNTGNSEEHAKKEEQAREQGRKLAREEAELWLNEAAERMKHGEKSDSAEAREHGGGWSKDDALDMEAGILEQAVEFGQFDED